MKTSRRYFGEAEEGFPTSLKLYNDAIQAYKGSLNIYSNRYDSKFNLSLVYLNQASDFKESNKPYAAIKVLENSMNVFDRKDGHIPFRIAEIYASLGDRNKTVSIYEDLKKFEKTEDWMLRSLERAMPEKHIFQTYEITDQQLITQFEVKRNHCQKVKSNRDFIVSVR